MNQAVLNETTSNLADELMAEVRPAHHSRSTSPTDASPLSDVVVPCSEIVMVDSEWT